MCNDRATIATLWTRRVNAVLFPADVSLGWTIARKRTVEFLDIDKDKKRVLWSLREWTPRLTGVLVRKSFRFSRGFQIWKIELPPVRSRTPRASDTFSRRVCVCVFSFYLLYVTLGTGLFLPYCWELTRSDDEPSTLPGAVFTIVDARLVSKSIFIVSLKFKLPESSYWI